MGLGKLGVFRAFGENKKQLAGAASWPKTLVMGEIKQRYQHHEVIGQEDEVTLIGVIDGNLNFIIALVEAHDAPEHIVEIGFLARFIGFSVVPELVDNINRNLNLAICGTEQNGDLLLLAGLQAVGPFDAAQFALLLEAWKRDVMMALHLLSDHSSISSAYPALQSERAMSFAANHAPVPPSDEAEATPSDLVRQFFGEGPRMALCDECDGRGRRGLIARQCDCCDGTGLISAR